MSNVIPFPAQPGKDDEDDDFTPEDVVFIDPDAG